MSFAALARSLEARAAALAKARAETRRHRSPWQQARLLWPLFTREER